MRFNKLQVLVQHLKPGTGTGNPNMKWNTPAGNYDENGNQLDATDNPPSGPGDWDLINFSDGGTTGHIINTQAAYTLIKGQNLCTVPQINGPALLDRTILELQDATDLENFRVGDPVTQGPAASGVTGVITEIVGNDVTLKDVVGDWIPGTGNYIIGPDTTPGTGTLSSVNTSQNKMFLSDIDETFPKRWIVNQGKKVVGPPKDASSVDAYLLWRDDEVVNVVRDDPGYAPAPPGLQLQFKDPRLQATPGITNCPLEPACQRVSKRQTLKALANRNGRLLSPLALPQ